MRHQKSAGNRLPEKWFRRGLWLIAFIFASFLIGLGGKVINDLPSVEQTRELDDYMGEKGILLQQTRDRLNEEDTRLTEEAERSALELEKQRNQTAAEQQSLQNWLAARSATEQSEQNPEVIARTRKLDELKAKEQTLQQQYAAIQQRQLDNRQQRASMLLKDVAYRIEACIKEKFGLEIVPINIIDLDDPNDMFLYKRIILGMPTWNYGEYQDDWELVVDKIASADLKGTVIAMFGLGDQIGYPEYYLDAMGMLAEQLGAQGATFVGEWPSADYKFASSKAPPPPQSPRPHPPNQPSRSVHLRYDRDVGHWREPASART